MKTFVRLIRRYILMTAGIVLLTLAIGLGGLVWLGWREDGQVLQRTYGYGSIAEAIVETPAGLALDSQRSSEQWLEGYAWAMVLSDDGEVIWSWRLPASLNRRYTAGDVAGFSRWYLEDYPVFCQREDYGLFVVALEKGSLWRYSFYSSPGTLEGLARSIPLGFALLLGAALVGCTWLGWRGAKRLKTVAAGLDALAEGQAVQLPTEGFAGELAETLNRTGKQLQSRNALLARRDDARTQWIAGVSHDVRTPLALIMGWAEQLEGDTVLPEAAQQKATGIRGQCQRLRSLIDDLNLTSKLEYGAQPLRRETYPAGPLFRELTARFCDGPLGDRAGISLVQTEQAQRAQLSVDRALLERLLDNLLSNCLRHNPGAVSIAVQTEVKQDLFCLTVSDDGQGYPPEVLEALHGAQTENAPHILGLHVVEQIAAAHGGRAEFSQNSPRGAKALVWLPLQKNMAWCER